MPDRITETQRQAVLRLLAQGEDRETIAAKVGITPGQVSSVAAHVKMGTYPLPEIGVEEQEGSSEQDNKTRNLLEKMRNLGRRPAVQTQLEPIFLGVDTEHDKKVFWNPDPDSGSANPHVLILGESGFGKTYTIACLLAELAQRNISSVIFDYGQGFTPSTLPPEFLNVANLVEIQASRDGIEINPLQIFPSDILGPVNVAQRVADTFARVYPKIGVQQHAVLRHAVLEVMSDEGIISDDTNSWTQDLPSFANVHLKLTTYANNPQNSHSHNAASVASHISTLFFFNTFRSNGQKIAWQEVIDAKGRVLIIQLKGLEHSLERAVTEFLLWNLVGYIEALGPSPLRYFVVLDEAHKLSFDQGSPVEKLLREGRKFGLGLILASQQPEDFSPVAFANTATKIVFQVGDEKSTISRQLHRKVRDTHSFGDIFHLISKLPRGCAYVVSQNLGHFVRIGSFSDRERLWKL
ncbi:MAG: DUF87 domain-containing protein [Deltaproteobacteria bacterium]|nr:DUF87 domain-containing protein [Deltaproteobacteria bacterium]